MIGPDIERFRQTDDMIEQLGSLLLPIDALLAQTDFNVRSNASPGVVAHFRNMWFLCVLFHFTSVEDKEDSAMDWLKPALARISAKTPAMVIEEAHESVASDVEYSSVIRQEYAHTVGLSPGVSVFNAEYNPQVISKHRTVLLRHISLRASDIRGLSSGQVIFILTMHDIESMRSAAGLTSSLVTFFINDSLNNHYGLSVCMESIAEKVRCQGSHFA